ncbi:MAG: HAD family hydrolase [Thermoanaerobaculia bacterium]
MTGREGFLEVGASFPRGFKAVVFDLDGTLLDSYAAIHASVAKVQRHFGLPEWTLDETRRRVGRGIDVLMSEAVGSSRKDEGVRLFSESYEASGPEATGLLPGADDVTRTLHDRGVRLAVASNKPGIFSRKILSHLGLLGRFGVVNGPDDGFPPKPAPHMVFMALALLGVPASEALFVGDMPIDILTARAANVAVAAVPSGSATAAELAAAGPDVLLTSLVDLIRLFPAVGKERDGSLP